MASLARRGRLQRVSHGAALVKRGERLPGFCVLASGTVKLAVELPGRGERVLGLIAGHTTFGEALALRRRASSYDIVALTDAAVLVLPVVAVEALGAAAPRFAANLVDLLAERTLALQSELEAGLLQRAPQRLAAYLCSLAGGAQDRVRLPVSKTMVAAILGMKKETLSRLLRDLAERRLIAVSRREVTLLDRERLGEVT